MKELESVCKLLKRTRLERGMTLRDVERKCGISFSTVSLIENYRHAFSLENLMKLAKAYEVPASYFLRAADGATRQPEPWTSPTKWQESFADAQATAVQEEILNPVAQHKKVKVALVKMEAMSEVSWQQPTDGALYLYLVSGQVKVLLDDAEPIVLEENGHCNYELNKRARVQAVKASCLYVTRIKS